MKRGRVHLQAGNGIIESYFAAMAARLQADGKGAATLMDYWWFSNGASAVLDALEAASASAETVAEFYAVLRQLIEESNAMADKLRAVKEEASCPSPTTLQ